MTEVSRYIEISEEIANLIIDMERAADPQKSTRILWRLRQLEKERKRILNPELSEEALKEM